MVCLELSKHVDYLDRQGRPKKNPSRPHTTYKYIYSSEGFKCCPLQNVIAFFGQTVSLWVLSKTGSSWLDKLNLMYKIEKMYAINIVSIKICYYLSRSIDKSYVKWWNLPSPGIRGTNSPGVYRTGLMEQSADATDICYLYIMYMMHSSSLYNCMY